MCKRPVNSTPSVLIPPVFLTFGTSLIKSSLTAGFLTAVVCEGSSAVLHCPHDSVINIQSAFFGRKSADICPHFEGSEGVCTCTVQGILPRYRKVCDNRPFCFAYAHVEEDPCPTISKYLEIVYSCDSSASSRWSSITRQA
uniref:SUEL-type lectin domain-containing protein n=1 Tax=Oryzias latipes TaxID=8090 RepID=A0A3P9J693_ORYLA